MMSPTIYNATSHSLHPHWSDEQPSYPKVIHEPLGDYVFVRLAAVFRPFRLEHPTAEQTALHNCLSHSFARSSTELVSSSRSILSLGNRSRNRGSKRPSAVVISFIS